MTNDAPRDEVEIRSPSLGVVLVVGAALVMLLLVLSVTGGFLLYQRLRPRPATPVADRTPSPNVTPAPRASPTGKITEPAKPAAAARRRRTNDKWGEWRGTVAPDLSVVTLRGERLSLASLRGKRVVLDFWATWCKPCVDAIPDLNRLSREWEKDVVVIGITNEERGHVEAFAREKGMQYHVVAGIDEDALPRPFRDVAAWPTVFFIERDGRIGSVLEGYHHYDCMESRLWVGDAAARWTQGRRQEALDLAARTLEVHLDADTEDALVEIFGEDPAYAALHERIKTRVEGLLGHYERKYDRDFGRDRAAVLWVIWSLGAERKDAEAVPHLVRYLRESTIEEARWRAADALWQIDDTRAVPDLIAALQDPSLKVQGFAASALGGLGDPRAVEPLLALFAKLTDNREETKARIADALGKLGDARAIAPIEASLARIDEPRYVYWAKPALEKLRAAAAGSDVATRP